MGNIDVWWCVPRSLPSLCGRKAHGGSAWLCSRHSTSGISVPRKITTRGPGFVPQLDLGAQNIGNSLSVQGLMK